MPKLTDTQLVILSAAAERDGGAVLPLPKSLRTNKATIAKSIKSLIDRGLVHEEPAARDEAAWREAEDPARLPLVWHPVHSPQRWRQAATVLFPRLPQAIPRRVSGLGRGSGGERSVTGVGPQTRAGAT